MLAAFAGYFGRNLKGDHEILVVANGCTDHTAALAREIAEQYPPQVKVIEELGRIGKGGAVIRGVHQAYGDWIGFVDADGATSPEEFKRLFDRAQADGGGGIIASRWKKGSTVNVPQKGLRLLSSRLFNLMIRVLLGLKFVDTQCGAKIFKADAWRRILPEVGTTRFAFDVDVLYQLKRQGIQIREEPTVWNDVEGSKVRIFNTSFDMFCAVVRMRLLFSPLRFMVIWYEHFLSKAVEFCLRDDLFRHASLLFFASILAAFGNVGFQMIVGRALPQAEYALLATFLALFAIISRPLGTLSTAMTHYTSLLIQENKSGVVERLFRKWVIRAGMVSVILSAICVVFSKEIAGFFHLERIAPIVVSALALPALFVGPVLGGLLRGLQRFALVSIGGISNALGRVVFGGFFVWMLFPACGWALAGHVAGLYVSLIVFGAVLIPWMLKNKWDGEKLPSFRLYLLQCFFIQISIAVLMTGDVVMVKHYLPDEMDFAYAATLGRTIAFMALSVAAAMFPKVVSSGGFTTQHRALYLRSQLYTSGFVGISLILCMLFPAHIHRLLFGIVEPSSGLLTLTRWMAVVMAIATLLNINVNLLLAQRRFKSLYFVVASALVYLLVVHLYHPSAVAIVMVCGVSNLVALVVTTCVILLRRPPDTKDDL